MSIRDQIAWRAVISKLRAYYIHNVFHSHKNQFGKGPASDGVMLLVKAVDTGVDLQALIKLVHDKHDGVAFVNDKESKAAYKLLGEMVSL